MIPGRHIYFLIGFGQFPRGFQRPEIFRAIGENYFFFYLGSNRLGRVFARTSPNPTPVKEPVTEMRLRRDKYDFPIFEIKTLWEKKNGIRG